MTTTISNISLRNIRNLNDPSLRKTKITCTLGPSCWSVDGLVGLLDAGMNIARFNFSHGDHASHHATLLRLREALSLRPGNHCAVMLDTKGPEIRTGLVDPSLGGKLKLVKGAHIEIGTDYSRLCTNDYLACSYPSLSKSVQIGSKILVADGSLLLEVKERKETSVIAEILNNASIGDKKNMNLPGAVVDLPTLTEKDIDDLKNFGVRYQVDFIAASFVRKASDLDFIRQVLGPEGSSIKIISKIENQEGLENYDEILAKTDGIMVARGDLGMEIPIEKVFIAQKMMISRANLAGKPVVTATQMLESMITNPRPTRAECADVANAVLDGTDCVMLSGETANGDFPVDAVVMMRNTCVEAESVIDYDVSHDNMKHKMLNKEISAAEAIASSAVKTAKDVRAKALIILTETGTTARLIAKYRPHCPTLAITSVAATARQVNGFVSDCRSLLVDSMSDTDTLITLGLDWVRSNNIAARGDLVVCVFGSSEKAGSTNLLRVYTV